MTGTYNPLLVVLSYVIAVVASHTALELGRRVVQARGLTANLWLTAGACSMGTGIWTMHFVGMLAYRMPMNHSYDLTLTVISLLVGVGAAAFATSVASRPTNNFGNIVASGTILGGGIAAMHYTGMAAMQVDAVVHYDTRFVLLSIVIAIIAASAAIWIIFTLTRSHDVPPPLLKLAAALIMGVAVCGMHYTGMYAVSYTPWLVVDHAPVDADMTWVAVVVGGMALFIAGVTQMTIFFGSRLAIEKEQGQISANHAGRLSQILDELNNEVYVFHGDTLQFLRVNRSACGNLGYSEEELGWMTPCDLVPEQEVAKLEERLQLLRDGTRKDLLYNSVHVRKDSSEYQVQVHLQASSSTEPPAFVAIVNDITERLDLERQLAQAQKMESIGQLAAGIAHEINTPAQFVGDNTTFLQGAFGELMALNRSYADLLAAVKSGGVTAEQIKLVEDAVQVADPEYLDDEIPAAIEQSLEGISRISNIVRAMKEFSHPGSKTREKTDLNSAVSNTVTVASNEWKYVADVEVELDETLPLVPCFAQDINQVVLNLIVNAAHAIGESMGNNPGRKGTIRIATRHCSECAEISVADNGSGIPDDIRDRIFDPFFTTKEVGKGSGQGLAMAFHTIVEKHQGVLDVSSEVGKGTTFFIRLPLAADDDNDESGVAGQVAA